MVKFHITIRSLHSSALGLSSIMLTHMIFDKAVRWIRTKDYHIGKINVQIIKNPCCKKLTVYAAILVVLEVLIIV